MASSKASMKYKREESQTEYFDDSQQIELDTLVCDYIENIENESIECLGKALFDSLEGAWTTVETSLRVSQSFINVLPKSVCDLVKLKALYEKLLSLSSFSFPQNTRLCSTELLQVIDPFLNPQLDSYGFDSYQHRNVCLVLLLVLPKYSHEFVNATDNVINQLFRYLMNVLANYKHMESVLYALLTLEMMADGQMLELTKDQLDHIDKALSNLLKIIDQFFTLKPSRFIRHQVLLCANHLMRRFSISEESNTKSLVKLSSNCQTVRCDCAQCPTVRAQFPASQEHSSYYEVTLQSYGPVIIGWCTRESQLGSTLIAEMASNHRLGSDQYSIGFDGYSRVIWHANHPNETKLDRWKAKDVIGCMFVPQSDRQFHFFLNGKPIDCTVHHYFSHQPYFAAITLYPHQQVYVNFGQQPFKYQPESLEDAIQPQMCLLVEPNIIECLYWFKQDLNSNYRVDALFCDPKQVNYDQWAIALEDNCENNMESMLQSGPKYLFQTLNSVANKLDCIRVIQSVMEIGTSQGHSFSLTHNYHIITKLLYQFHFQLNNSFGQGFPTINKILELLYPYMQLDQHNLDNFFTHRKTLIVLVVAKQLYSYSYGVNICEEECVIHFLERIISKARDRYSLLFAIICLDVYTLRNAIFEMPNNILSKLHQIASNRKCDEEFKFKIVQNFGVYNAIDSQIEFCAEWILNKLIDSRKQETILSEFVLNPNDCSPYLKLSLNHLSVRCDRFAFDHVNHRGFNRAPLSSVRSTFAVTSNLYFYQATTLTCSGPARIGWATRECDLVGSNAIGDDPHSIAFDGYTRCVWHNGRSIPVEMPSQWKVGDIVVLFDKCAKKEIQLLSQRSNDSI